jgi:cysteinyl-tRNA synthetase
MQVYIRDYIEKLEDDFNMPEALAIFHSLVKFVNT